MLSLSTCKVITWQSWMPFTSTNAKTVMSTGASITIWTIDTSNRPVTWDNNLRQYLRKWGSKTVMKFQSTPIFPTSKNVFSLDFSPRFLFSKRTTSTWQSKIHRLSSFIPAQCFHTNRNSFSTMSWSSPKRTTWERSCKSNQNGSSRLLRSISNLSQSKTLKPERPFKKCKNRISKAFPKRNDLIEVYINRDSIWI